MSEKLEKCNITRDGLNAILKLEEDAKTLGFTNKEAGIASLILTRAICVYTLDGDPLTVDSLREYCESIDVELDSGLMLAIMLAFQGLVPRISDTRRLMLVREESGRKGGKSKKKKIVEPEDIDGDLFDDDFLDKDILP